MKTFSAIITVLFLGFAGFVATIIAALSRDAEFYTPFSIIVTIGFITIIILAIYGKLKKKLLRSLSIVFVTLCVLFPISIEGYQMYLKSLEVVSNQDVDLTEYRPFRENTKAISLDEPSTYKIAGELPKLDGATALYPVYAGFVQAVYPNKSYSLVNSEVVSTQTSGAFDRLIHGEIDIAFLARPSKAQMNYSKEIGVNLTLTPIGREAFVFFVHSKNPVEVLSVSQIQAIYSGQIQNWQEVGGNNEKIRAFQRPEESGSQSALQNLMNGKQLMTPPSEDIVSAMGGIITGTTSYQNRTNAIGFSFRHFSQEMVTDGKIKYIAVNDILPSKETIQNGTYPLVSEFYAITAESKNPHVTQFIEWMQSEQGQKIVDLTGYVPIK